MITYTGRLSFGHPIILVGPNWASSDAEKIPTKEKCAEIRKIATEERKEEEEEEDKKKKKKKKKIKEMKLEKKEKSEKN